MENIEINEQFEKALNQMENTSENVFITGKAGTGKSTLLDYFRNHTKKNVVVLAPTGVSAINVKGQTIHSFFGFKPDISMDKVRKTKRADKKKLYLGIDAVIIDEISMVRADLLDCVDKFMRLNCGKLRLSFGGKQMIFIGDLYQLPPVIKGIEKDIFRNKYETGYFFSANAFKDIKMSLLELEKIYRQKDEKFIEILNAIRNNTIDDILLGVLNSKSTPPMYRGEKDFFIYLTTLNAHALKLNEERLIDIPGELHEFEGKIIGEFRQNDLPTENRLLLKIGAQVMLLNNDSAGRWFNGTIGKVAGVKYPKKSGDAIITVELIDGSRVEVKPYEWDLFRYDYNEQTGNLESNAIGSFVQYPLRLAWAITIHKSQGKTFDRVILDIGKGAFSPGQVYVGLSRCVSLDNLILKQPILKNHIFTDWRVIDFLTKYQYKLANEKLPLEEKIKIIEKAILNKTDLEIVYLKKSDEKSRRIIRPRYVGEITYKDVLFTGVTAFCTKRQDLRTFHIDRILEMKEVK